MQWKLLFCIRYRQEERCGDLHKIPVLTHTIGVPGEKKSIEKTELGRRTTSYTYSKKEVLSVEFTEK
jgi:hypothetical protein